MQTPYHSPHPNDRIYAHDSNPIPELKSLNIGSSRLGGLTKDAPMYVGYILMRKAVPGNPRFWEDCEIPETVEELERKLSKWKSESVDYSHVDMDGADKRDEVDRIIKRENNKYPGYMYKLRLLKLKEGRNREKKRICTKMTIILQRQPATKAKFKFQSEDPKRDPRDPSTGLPIRKPTQALHGDDSVGYRDKGLKGDAGITGIQYWPQDPIYTPEHYNSSPPPPPAYPGLQFPASPHSHPGEGPRFQTPHHEGERFDGPAQNDRFPEPHFNNAGPPMQNPHVSFEDQQNHGGLGHHPNTQGSDHIPPPRSGAGHHPIIQEEYPLPRSGVGHHTNPEDEFNPRPRSGAGHHPSMQGENNNPRPVSRVGDRFDGRDHHRTPPNGQAEQRFDGRDHHHAHPNGQAEQRFDIHEEFLNHPRGGGGPQFEAFQGNQPHLHPQSKKENRSSDTRGDVYGARRNAEWKGPRDSGYFSGESSDGARSDYRNDQNFAKAYTGPRRNDQNFAKPYTEPRRNDQNFAKSYTEPRGKETYQRDHQHGHQKDDYQSRDRSIDRDSDSDWKYRNHHTREQFNHNFRRRGSQQSLGSAYGQYESDYNGRTASYNKNRQNRRNGSRGMNEEYGDMRSNEYLTPGDDSDWYSEDENLRSNRGSGSPPKFPRSKRMPNVRTYDPRDLLDILDERGPEWKRREAEKLREKRQRRPDKLRLDSEREETRKARESNGRRSSGGTLPGSRRTTHRQSH